MKRCATCGETKDESEFSKNKSRKDGMHSDCKICNAAYHAKHREEIVARKAAYYAEHREEHAERAAAYRAEHREEIAARRATYYANHRNEYADYHQAYYTEHRDQIVLRGVRYYTEHRKEISLRAAVYYVEHRDETLARSAAWQKANPGKVRANCHRRRARKAGNGGSHTAEDIQCQGDSQNWKCWWRGPGCAVDCKDDYHVDHLIPLARGGHNNPSNIVIACPKCNLSKQDKLPGEWLGKLL